MRKHAGVSAAWRATYGKLQTRPQRNRPDHAVLVITLASQVVHAGSVEPIHALLGRHPLHLAAAGLRYDAARALLAAGAPVSTINRRGATALHYACDPRPSSPTWDPASQRRIIELLASHGAEVDRPDRGGVTALHRAARARSPAAVARCCRPAPIRARRPGRRARPRCTSRSRRPARAEPPEPANSRSRSYGCSSPPERPWPTSTATAWPSPTASTAGRCARHWPPRNCKFRRRGADHLTAPLATTPAHCHYPGCRALRVQVGWRTTWPPGRRGEVRAGVTRGGSA